MKNPPLTSKKNDRGSETVLNYACGPNLPCRRGSHEGESCEGSLFPCHENVTTNFEVKFENRKPRQQTVKRGSNLARQAVRGALIGLNLSRSEQNRMGCLQPLPER